MSHLSSGCNFLLDQHSVYVVFTEYVKMTRHHPCKIVLKICENDQYGQMQLFVCCAQD